MIAPGGQRALMLAGELYVSNDPDLVAARLRAQTILRAYNASDPASLEARASMLRDLLGRVGEGTVIMPPFACDYGFNIRGGRDLFMNFGCIVLDCAPVEIGDDVQIGPAVQLYTATHPMDVATRRTGIEAARPIRIGDGVWLGGGAIVLPGVTIGEGAVVGAGAVVTRDAAAGAVVAGNPARPIR